MKIEGNLTVKKDEFTDYNDLTEVTGYIYLNEGTKLDAPKLETVGGYIRLDQDANLILPSLETIGKYTYLSPGVTLSVPKLESIGGNIYLKQGAKIITPENININKHGAISLYELNLSLALFMKGLMLVDGILSKIISEKVFNGINIIKVINVGDIEESYIAQDGDVFAHGKTIREAIEDLKYKFKIRGE